MCGFPEHIIGSQVYLEVVDNSGEELRCGGSVLSPRQSRHSPCLMAVLLHPFLTVNFDFTTDGVVILTCQVHHNSSPLPGGQMREACKEGVGPPGGPRHLRRGLGVVPPRQEGVHGLPSSVQPSVGPPCPF